MTSLDGRPRDLERHHDDRARRGKGAGEELDDVRAARELGLDAGNILRAGELGESCRKNVVGAASGRREACARGENRGPGNLAAIDAASKRECVGEQGAGVDDVDDTVGGHHRAERADESLGARGLRPAKLRAREMDVAVPEPGGERSARAVDDRGALWSAEGRAGTDGGDGRSFDEDHAIGNRRGLR